MASEEYYFRIWSRPLQSDDTSSIDGRRELFTSTEFDQFSENNDFFLEYQLKTIQSSTLNIIELGTYTDAVDKRLESIFSKFPCELLRKVVENASSRQNTSMIPNTYENEANFYCLINHPYLIDTNLIGFLPIATWTCSSPPTDSTDKEASIFIICTSPIVGRLVGSHYSSAYEKRWMRLQQNPLWIFADLLYIFGAWGKVFNTMKHNLSKYQSQIYGNSGTGPLLDLARTLRGEIAKILSVREQLRVHKSAITRFQRLNGVTTIPKLAKRAQEQPEDIAFHEETSKVQRLSCGSLKT
ncbi:hypothetical protein PENSTE_c023G00546 [Penicillium steckii]|uniref:Uncharacterized protein n=1 Tax=Penicillium steckii TaxID=303698 RepID=A0A1V6SSV7_9EURO|nr:hypothetical protein PENSTE_c023G00546 [Penicillium steckii]